MTLAFWGARIRRIYRENPSMGITVRCRFYWWHRLWKTKKYKQARLLEYVLISQEGQIRRQLTDEICGLTLGNCTEDVFDFESAAEWTSGVNPALQEDAGRPLADTLLDQIKRAWRRSPNDA